MNDLLRAQSLRHLKIFNTGTVTLKLHSVRWLPDLEDILFYNIDSLVIEEKSLTPHESGTLTSIDINSVTSLKIEQFAFSGVWRPEAEITIRNIRTCSISSHAFNFSSNLPGPRVEITNISSLHLAPQAFTAVISRLVLSNLSTAACHPRTFGGSITSLELTHADIGEVQGRCVASFDGCQRLSLLSCTLGIVHPWAFTRKIEVVFIDNTSFTEIQANAFATAGQSFQIHRSSIQSLNANSLYVLAEDTVIKNVTVENLRAHSLSLLWTSTEPVVVQHLQINNAENGSLYFGNWTRVHITGIEFVRCECPLEPWIDALVSDPKRNSTSMTAPQKDSGRQVLNQTRCAREEGEIVAGVKFCKTRSVRRVSSITEDYTPVVWATVALLTMMMAMALVILLVRRKRARSEAKKLLNMELTTCELYEATTVRKSSRETGTGNSYSEEDAIYEQPLYEVTDLTAREGETQSDGGFCSMNSAMKNSDIFENRKTPAELLGVAEEDDYEEIRHIDENPGNEPDRANGAEGNLSATLTNSGSGILVNNMYASAGEDVSAEDGSNYREQAVNQCLPDYEEIRLPSGEYEELPEAHELVDYGEAQTALPEYAMVLPRSERNMPLGAEQAVSRKDSLPIRERSDNASLAGQALETIPESLTECDKTLPPPARENHSENSSD